MLLNALWWCFGFSLMREKMKTKKLVLGFCVLAAATGSAPQVFGEGISQRDLLYCISDTGRRLLAQGRLVGVEKRLQIETAELASMCNEEIGFVRKIRESERRSYILGTIANDKEREINKEVSDRQGDLTRAENALKGARYFRRLRSAICEWRKSKLEKAEQKEALILAQVADLRRDAADFIRATNQDRARALTFHTERVARLTKIAEGWMSEHEKGLIADAESFRRGGLSVADLEMMEGRLIIDVVVLDAAERIRSDLERVRDAIWCNQLPNDYEWFHLNVGGGRWLYRKLTAKYSPGYVGYVLDRSFGQIDRLKSAFSGSDHLEAQVRARLDRAASGAAPTS
jgi:hypothetical protein